MWQWGLSAFWFIAVAYNVINGMTETEPGPWLHALLMLVGLAVMSWRFFSPSMVIAPAPLAPLTALGAAGVAGHGLWSGFSVGNSGNSSEPHLHIQASRNGQPLRLRFTDVTGRLSRGRIIVISRHRRQPAPRGV